MVVKKGKTYLIERTTKAYGGGKFEVHIQNMTNTHIKLHNNWQTKKSFEENYNVLDEITENDQ